MRGHNNMYSNLLVLQHTYSIIYISKFDENSNTYRLYTDKR